MNLIHHTWSEGLFWKYVEGEISIREITALEDFLDIKEKGSGYIVITDVYNPVRVHKPSCSWVTVENFTTKVIDNKNSLGQYFWSETVMTAKEEWNAFECGKCLAQSGNHK
jgi:hypothetical protein